MFKLLRSYVFSGGPTEEVVECRNCGTTLGAEDPECPNCGSSDVARYEID